MYLIERADTYPAILHPDANRPDILPVKENQGNSQRSGFHWDHLNPKIIKECQSKNKANAVL
jgi:hypothetical protein